MTFRNRLNTLATLPICAAVLLARARYAGAGDLNPPVGPVAPTHKTLTEVEPRIAVNSTNTPGDADSLFRISQPGSYYLTGNITGVAAKHGVEIAASGVTLDLNGFDLLGVAGSLDGVSASVSILTNIAVINGSIRSWGGDGVDLASLNAINLRLADLRAAGNAGSGIRAGNGCTITGCTAYLNTSNGISMANGCTITGCTAYGNISNGIVANFGCTITGCTAYDNSTNGISAGSACTIFGCASRANTLDGIVVPLTCLVLGNTCAANGNGGDGSGIHATGGDNRIEGNNCTAADRGIDVDLAGNFIIKNTCSGNTINWVIVADNVCGPILDRTAPASAAISGNSAPDSTASTHPNANFSY